MELQGLAQRPSARFAEQVPQGLVEAESRSAVPPEERPETSAQGPAGFDAQARMERLRGRVTLDSPRGGQGIPSLQVAMNPPHQDLFGAGDRQAFSPTVGLQFDF